MVLSVMFYLAKCSAFFKAICNLVVVLLKKEEKEVYISHKFFSWDKQNFHNIQLSLKEIRCNVDGVHYILQSDFK